MRAHLAQHRFKGRQRRRIVTVDADFGQLRRERLGQFLVIDQDTRRPIAAARSHHRLRYGICDKRQDGFGRGTLFLHHEHADGAAFRIEHEHQVRAILGPVLRRDPGGRGRTVACQVAVV